MSFHDQGNKKQFTCCAFVLSRFSCVQLCDPTDCSPQAPLSPGKNTGVGCRSLLQGFFPTQESNQGILHCNWIFYQLSYQFSSVAQSCPTLCESESQHAGFPVITNSWSSPKLVHRVGDAIQPSHPLSSPSPPAPNPSQHQTFWPPQAVHHRPACDVSSESCQAAVPVPTLESPPGPPRVGLRTPSGLLPGCRNMETTFAFCTKSEQLQQTVPRSTSSSYCRQCLG